MIQIPGSWDARWFSPRALLARPRVALESWARPSGISTKTGVPTWRSQVAADYVTLLIGRVDKTSPHLSQGGVVDQPRRRTSRRYAVAPAQCSQTRAYGVRWRSSG